MKFNTLKVIFALGLSALSSAAISGLIDIRDHRLPSEQGRILNGLGIGNIDLKYEANSEHDENDENSRRVLYLPSSPRELAIVLDMVLSLSAGPQNRTSSFSFWKFVSFSSSSILPGQATGYDESTGKLIAIIDDICCIKFGHEPKKLELDLAGLISEYRQIEVIRNSAWQSDWEGSLGLKFALPQDRSIEIYFPTKFGGFVPTIQHKPGWLVDEDAGEPNLWSDRKKKKPSKLYTIEMLHALSHSDAPKWDAFWVFFDGELGIPKNGGNMTNHLRGLNQVNDYGMHQALRQEDQFQGPEKMKPYYDKMWSYALENSVSDPEEQLRKYDSETTTPFFLQELLEKDPEGCRRQLFKGHPLKTFKELSLLSAYGNLSLELGIGADCRYSEVRGGAVSPVPDGIWDGRFKLFPHKLAHMLIFGMPNCNCGISPFKGYDPRQPCLKSNPLYERFRDGVHCGFAKPDNCWVIEAGKYKESIGFLDRHVQMLLDSVWHSLGRFYYVKTEPMKMAPMLNEKAGVPEVYGLRALQKLDSTGFKQSFDASPTKSHQDTGREHQGKEGESISPQIGKKEIYLGAAIITSVIVLGCLIAL